MQKWKEVIDKDEDNPCTDFGFTIRTQLDPSPSKDPLTLLAAELCEITDDYQVIRCLFISICCCVETATAVWSFMTIIEPTGVCPTSLAKGSALTLCWLAKLPYVTCQLMVTLWVFVCELKTSHLWVSVYELAVESLCWVSLSTANRELTRTHKNDNTTTTDFFPLHISSCIKYDHLPFPSFKEVVIGVRKSHSCCERNRSIWCVNTVENVCWVTPSFKRITLLQHLTYVYCRLDSFSI